MSNGSLIVQSKGREGFDLALRLAYGETRSGEAGMRAIGFNMDARETGKLILLWHMSDREKSYPLPVGLNAEQAADMAWAWLASMDTGSYLESGYQGDGSSKAEGWRVTSGRDIPNYAIAMIQPVWAIYGK